MQTIFFNNISITLSAKKNKSNGKVDNIKVLNCDDINKFIKNLHTDKITVDVNLYGYDVVKMKQDFYNNYNYIEAAGGIVSNENNEYLLIKRLGLWDLPKGKVEKGESVEEAGIREVCEETGIPSASITKPIPNTFHIYLQKKKWYLKNTHWFLMHTKSKIALKPQQEESITKAVWVQKSKACKHISNSYRSIYDTLGYVFCS